MGRRDRIDGFLAQLPVEIKSYAGLALTSAGTQFVRFFTGILNARMLTPLLYATNSIVATILRYVSYSHGGAQNALNRQIPIEEGKGNQREMNLYLHSTFWLITGISFLLSVAAIVFYFDRIEFGEVLPVAYYPDLLALSVSTLYYQFFISLLISTKRFRIVSELRLKFDMVVAVLSVPSVYFFRLHGLLFIQAISMITQTVIIWGRISFRPAAEFSFRHLKSLWRVGFLILVTSVLILLFSTIDLLFVASRYEKTLVGLYGFALTGVMFFKIYSTSVSDVLAPKIGNAYGASGENPAGLQSFATDYTFALIPTLGMIASIFFFFLPLIIELFLPSYVGSILTFQLLIVAGVAMSIYIPCGHILTLLKKQKEMIAVVSASIGVLLISFKVVIPATAPLYVIAATVVVMSTFVSWTFILMATHYVYSGTLFPWKRILSSVYCYIIVCSVFVASLLTYRTVSDAYAHILLEVGKFLLAQMLFLTILARLDKKNALTKKALLILRSAIDVIVKKPHQLAE